MSRLASYVLQKIESLDRFWNEAFARVHHHVIRKLAHARAGRRFQFTRTWIGEYGLPGRDKRIISPEKRLSIVIVTYQQPDELTCLLFAFATQTLQNFEIIVLHDGPDATTRGVVQDFRDKHPLVPCRYLESDHRHNDYGHSLRQIGIEEANCEYILITNGDNYYVARFVEFLFAAIDQFGLDLVLFDMVHSHQAYAAVSTEPLHSRMDMGSMVVRTDMAKRVGFRDKAFEGDATYLEDLLENKDGPCKVGKLCKTLFVHN